ncbi:hypothetical protein C0992_006845 [Termitomyces sp. T32_za158]|nr:hypothetical protein C0992_006845 [Termitomyces sp. T32_za158]
MAMQSKVGNPQVYEAGDQRPPRVGPRDAGEDPTRQESYKIGSDKDHLDLDSNIANRLAAAKKASEEKSHETVHDPLAPARAHGNEPSRGAKIDAEIQAEEEELLKRKDKA